MNKSDFLRVFPLRAPNIMWLLGAGASASGGIRTAGQMIWHFKQQIFCSEQRISIKSCPDLGEPSFRDRLNKYFQSKGGYPAPWSDDEYSFYFELAYPHEKDRRLYIDQLVRTGTPSNGHLALASFAKLGRLGTIWTTNFDRLPEDAMAKVFGTTTAFAVATLDAPELAEQALSEANRPLIVKLHGDCLSQRLKNIKEELQTQDARLRRAMLTECQRKGLAVVGFSGRDDSVMSMLECAVDDGHGYPNGLFWFHRPDSPPLPRVEKLIEHARSKKVDAHIIEAETFDELMLDLFLLMQDVPEQIKAVFDERRSRRTLVEIPQPGFAFPIIRLNALPLSMVPATCRSVECTIGGTADVRAAVKASGVDVIAARRKTAVICFGTDADVRKAFAACNITTFDLYPIESRRLCYDSAELGLLNEALCRAFTRERPLLGAVPARSGWKLYILPAMANDPRVAKLRSVAKTVTGMIPGTKLVWAEAVRVRMERKLERNWLLFEPTVWVDYLDASGNEGESEDPPLEARPDASDSIKEFIRERAARRYNYVLTGLLDGWVELLIGPPTTNETTIRAFGIGDGIDASFTILRTTAFSGRGGTR